MTKEGDTIDFYLSHTRNTTAAKRFLNKDLKLNKYWIPSRINTDKNPAYNQAIAELKAENDSYAHIKHRKVKYLNNQPELKKLMNMGDVSILLNLSITTIERMLLENKFIEPDYRLSGRHIRMWESKSVLNWLAKQGQAIT